MWSAFVSGIGGKLAESWIAALLAPAFVFWGGGLALALTRHEFPGWLSSPWFESQAWSWRRLGEWFGGLTDLSQILLVAGVLIVVAASGAVMQAFVLPVLQWLEGYWPARLARLRSAMLRRKVERFKRAGERWDELAQKRLAQGSVLTAQERYEYNALDRLLTSIPSDYQEKDGRLVLVPEVSRLMPTQLGDVLRAAEFRPQVKYGLDAVVCWPRLWLLLPDSTKQDIDRARATLNTTTSVFCWSILFVVWSMFTWAAIPIGVIAAVLAYQAILGAARVYGNLIEASYDIHRLDLYKALRWPLPDPHTPSSEREAGRKLTGYLWQSYRPTAPVFATQQE